VRSGCNLEHLACGVGVPMDAVRQSLPRSRRPFTNYRWRGGDAAVGIACIEGARLNTIHRNQGSFHTICTLKSSLSSMFLLKILSALVALLLMASVRAEANVTIDDTDPQIVYQPPDVWNFQGNVRPSSFSGRRTLTLLL